MANNTFAMNDLTRELNTIKQDMKLIYQHCGLDASTPILANTSQSSCTTNSPTLFNSLGVSLFSHSIPELTARILHYTKTDPSLLNAPQVRALVAYNQTLMFNIHSPRSELLSNFYLLFDELFFGGALTGRYTIVVHNELDNPYRAWNASTTRVGFSDTQNSGIHAETHIWVPVNVTGAVNIAHAQTGILLHQMCHACFLLYANVKEYQAENIPCGKLGVDGHGECFLEVCKRVQDSANALLGIELRDVATHCMI